MVKFALMRKYCQEMKKILLSALGAVLVLSLSGCDLFRKMAGRPTSEDLNRRRIEILELRQASYLAQIDSLKEIERTLSDSISVLNSISQMSGTILNSSELGGLFTTKLDSKYYVVVGAFRSRNNAETLLRTVKKNGYSPILISFRNGLNAVGICPSESLSSVLGALKLVKEEPFCPEDVWILINE